jgi:hypothetical protein
MASFIANSLRTPYFYHVALSAYHNHWPTPLVVIPIASGRTPMRGID